MIEDAIMVILMLGSSLVVVIFMINELK